MRDWYGFHATIAPITTAAEFHAAFADPETRWYAQRRLNALAASGALVAAPLWNPNLHPRGHDGKFIQKFGWVRWFDQDKYQWRNGWVKDISPTDGKLTVRSGDETLTFPNAKNLYSKPKPKASLTLPNLLTGHIPQGWKKTGGQGGSNPGGMFQVEGNYSNESPDLTKRSGLHRMMSQMAAGEVGHLSGIQGGDTTPETSLVPSTENVVIVPRLDGTKGKYDVLQRMGSNWYRTPASGSVVEDDLLRPDLQVNPTDAFGAPGSVRRQAVLADPGSLVIGRDTDFDVADVADLVQSTASPLPAVGDKFYVKTMNTPERANNEALANDLYELLGVPVPDVAVGHDGKTVSSKLIGEKVDFDQSNPAHIKAAQDAFIADAWLANWDAVGLTYDNMQVDPDGNVWRIDAGGALLYRAQGSPKGNMFGNDVGEIESLRNPKVNAQAAKVFGSVTNAQMVEQAQRLAAVTPDQIKALAEANGMPDITPVLIARRKSVLDQLGVPDAPPLPPPVSTPPKIVFNPVEHAQQMGTAPSGAVKNWNAQWDPEGLGTMLTGAEWNAPGFLENAVFYKSDDVGAEGDLWTYEGNHEDLGGGSHRIKARNLFNGQTRSVILYDGMDGTLDMPKDDPELDQLMANWLPARDLAIAEFVDRNKDADLGAWDLNQSGDPNFLSYGQIGMPSYLHLMDGHDSGRLTDERNVIRNGQEGDLYEIDMFPVETGDPMVLHKVGTETPIELNSATWKATGPWFMPGSDGAAALWKARAQDAAPGGKIDSGQALDQKAKLDAALDTGVDDFIAKLPDDPIDLNSPATPGSDLNDAEPAVDLVGAPDSVIDAQQATVDEMLASSEATTNIKTVQNVSIAMGPSAEPFLSTEMHASDVDSIKAQLEGKSVVVLPLDAYDNPDWMLTTGSVLTGMTNNNGLGTVTAITTWPNGVDVKITVKYANGMSANFRSGNMANVKRMFVPVEVDPIPLAPTLKKDGSIVINGEKVGYYVKPWTPSGGGPTFDQYYSYNAVIDGDHSVTGKATVVTGSKQQDLKFGIISMVNPNSAKPKPSKPKSKKALATEQKLKDLNDQLAGVQTKIALTEESLAKLADAKPVGTPLNDGSFPEKGDWVYSTKDGVFAQVKQIDPKLGPKHTGLESNYIKVAIPVTQADGSVKWKWTNRPKDSLVSAAKPGDPPFALSTKAMVAGDGEYFGPGMMVETDAWGPVIAMDTTVDGKVKVKDLDGNQHWVLGEVIKGISPGEPKLTVKPWKGTGGSGSSADADALNAQLAALNDENVQLATSIASITTALSTGKGTTKPKSVGTPFPGPAGFTVSQPKSLAADRETAGLKNLKDGYAPTVGLVLRHNDGTQFVVVEVGDAHSSHKNSVQVRQLGETSSWSTAKWRAMSTMVVDHEAMSTNANGDPLPIITSVEGSDWVPNGQLIRRKYTKNFSTYDPVTHAYDYRTKETWKHYIVSETGEIYGLDGTKVSAWSTTSILGQGEHERIGYVIKGEPGGKTITVSIQPHKNANVGDIEYVSIHEPGTPSVSPAPVPKPNPPSGPAGTPIPTPTLNTPPIAQQTTTIPAVAVPEPTVDTPSTPELPVFGGTDPAGQEMPHPAVTTSSAGVPVFQAQGGTPTLDNAGVAKAKSVTAAIAETQSIAAKNKADGTKEWIGTYGLADSDVIEDMLVRSTLTRDAKGTDYIEVSFRVEKDPARTNFSTFMTSSSNQTGDWEHNGRNPKNLVPGDLVAVRVSSGGGVAPQGALKPDGDLANPKTPNATVVSAGVLIGQNKAGTHDVYRIQIVTAKGETGFVDLEDRAGADTIAVASWNPKKPRTSSGTKGLNPNAANDGWSVKSNDMKWYRTQTADAQVTEQDDDGVKKLGTKGYNSIKGYSLGSGWVLERDYNGAHVEYSTSSSKNTLDGHTTIRVRADDPLAHQKIADAMELVGVTKAKQAPPTPAALRQLAADKVFEQFNPTYTRGMTANGGISQALDAIDKAVGPQLGRKATEDDISVRFDSDGRVEVLVSEDVSRAIVKKNGVKVYTHDFRGQNVAGMVEQMMTGETPGLLSTTERWQHGLWYIGMSSAGDHPHDAADNMFLRMAKSISPSSNRALVDAVAMHRHVDYYYRTGDSFGDRDSNQLSWLNNPATGGSNELMVQRRLETEALGRVYLSDGERTALIKKLHAKGVTHAPNGQLIEDFIVTTSGPGATAPLPPPVFANEVLLSALVDDAAIPAPAMAGAQ